MIETKQFKIMLKTKQRRILILSCIVILLLIPLIAMQFTTEVNWSLMDFIIMGTLLLAVGFILELILSFAKNKVLKPFLISVLVLIFLLTWAELSVGVFGTPFAGS